MNIINDELTPKTFGEYIDSLIIINIRMWHEQEKIYEIDILKKMKKKEMFNFLKKATWLNLQRNFSIDGLDKILANEISNRFPHIKHKEKPLFLDSKKLIWEDF